MKDIKGKEISTGDLVNIFFTSNNGEHIHDCVFMATTGTLGDLQFVFKELLWESGGHNQYPTNQTLSLRYQTLDYRYKGENKILIVPDVFNQNHITRYKWKALDESKYFEIIKG